jgi:hypothetical protein
MAERYDFSGLADLGKTIATTWNAARREQSLASLGQQLKAQDYEGAAGTLLELGDTATAIPLLGKRDEQKAVGAFNSYVDKNYGGAANAPGTSVPTGFGAGEVNRQPMAPGQQPQAGGPGVPTFARMSTPPRASRR